MRRVLCWIIMGCFAFGCSEKEEEEVDIEAMVRLEEEESSWEPSKSALLGQEMPFIEDGSR